MDDTRLLSIVKAVALGPVNEDDFEPSCIFCHAQDESMISPTDIARIRHVPDCPVTLARAILKEQGTPVCVYRVDFEKNDFPNKKPAIWIPIYRSVIAHTPEDAVKECTWQHYRNAHATDVRELT